MIYDFGIKVVIDIEKLVNHKSLISRSIFKILTDQT